jgi:hypothetical protein
MCLFWTLPVFWKKKEFVGLHLDPTIVNLVGAWTCKVKSGREFVFPVHGMFFQPRHGTVILFRSTWLQHCTMPVWDRRRELGCALYLRKQTWTHYVARQTNLSRINEALNESMRRKNFTRRWRKGKICPLEGALRLTYRGSIIDVYDETGSSD